MKLEQSSQLVKSPNFFATLPNLYAIRYALNPSFILMPHRRLATCHFMLKCLGRISSQLTPTNAMDLAELVFFIKKEMFRFCLFYLAEGKNMDFDRPQKIFQLLQVLPKH